jgi:ribonuclease HI
MAKVKKYYAVVHGRAPGIYQNWDKKDGAQSQVNGYSGALYRSFATYKDAANWFREVSGGVEPRLIGSPSGTQLAQINDGLDYQKALKTGKAVIFTDGSSISNPGPGGYGTVILFQDQRSELSGGYRLTTNNRMELIACIMALRSLDKHADVLLYCDSRYVVNGISEGWAERWRSNGWVKADSKPVENSDLWGMLLEQTDAHNVELKWLAGHAGYKENERCDQLAQRAARGKYLQVDVGYEN